MRNRSYIVGIAVIFLIFGAWWFLRSNRKPASGLSIKTAGANSPSNNPIPAKSPDTSRLSRANSLAGEMPKKDFVDPKVAKIEAIWAAENSRAQDFYGRVIDQDGQAVVGATALGTLIWVQGLDVGEKREQHVTQTDQNGEFQFTGLHASRLAVAVSKEGYKMDSRGGAYKAPNAENKTSLHAPATFVMWKLKGADPMIAYSISTAIPCDGTATTYNLLTGKKMSVGGDLVIKLVRNPPNIIRGKPFDWTLTLEIASGGLTEISDLYPNEAPASGYHPSIIIDMASNMKNWQPALTRSFYFQVGKNYGRMTINVQSDFQPPPTYFGADVHINPSGSRNLEFDPAKQISIKP